MKESRLIAGLEGLFGSKEEIEDKTEIENGSKHVTGVDKLIGHRDGLSLRLNLKTDGETIRCSPTFGKSRHRR